MILLVVTPTDRSESACNRYVIIRDYDYKQEDDLKLDLYDLNYLQIH